MKLLVLGGTIFLGRHLVEAALRQGHEVTLFTRGKHNPDLFPDVEKLVGDRDGGLDPLRGRTWDAVVDTCGYFPRVVDASAQLLADAVGHYTFVSSLSVYADQSVGATEASPVGRLEDESTEKMTVEAYGPLKALCEEAAERRMPGRVLNVRPGLIVGPHDPSDRFTYWPRRIARGGEVLAPGAPDYPVQIIDARDLAEWILRMIDSGGVGVYNATGPDYTLTMGEVLEACVRESGSDARLTWIPDQTLLEMEVGPWMEMPLWIPDTPESRGFSRTDCSKAFAAGLTFRDPANTIADTLAWDSTLPQNREMRAGMAPEREKELLARWKESVEG